MGEKLNFCPKNIKKLRFLGFSHINPLMRFAFLLYCSDDAQTYRMAAHLVVEGVPIIKRANLVGKKYVLGEKTSKKRVFWGFPIKLQENALQFCCNAPIKLKLTG